MKLADYPYGKPSKSLKKAVKWLNSNRKKLEAAKSQYGFDYPDYFDMPKTISHKLGGDEVDWLQGELYQLLPAKARSL